MSMITQQISTLRNQGKSYSDIGKVLGISRQRVHQLTKKYKLFHCQGRVEHLRSEISNPIVNDKGKNFVKNWPRSLYWLWRKLQTKTGWSKTQKLEIFDCLRTNLPSKCPVLGLQLDYSVKTPRTDHSPSIDRVDNTKGYVKGNVQIISWRANRIKMDGTAEEHHKIADYITQITSS